MIGLKLEEVKGKFFDSDAVKAKLTDTERRVLSRFGAIAMRKDRGSIKAGKEVSRPGQPPTAHTSQTKLRTNRKGVQRAQKRYQFRDSILFYYDMRALSVVIGATLFNGARAAPTIPELLEKGGSVQGKDQDGKPVTKRYRPRPHTGPTFADTLKKLPGLFGR